MKRYIIFLLAIALTSMVACKKDHSSTSNGKTSQRVSFTVTGNFTGQIIPQSAVGASGRNLVTTVTPTIQNTFDTIFYRAYDLTGKVIKAKSYSAKTFTNIVDTLQNGDYKIAIYAGKKGFNGTSYGTGSAPTTRFDANTYGSTFAFTVGGTNTTQPVTINRLVGEVTFTINDAIPANTKKLTATQDVDYFSYDMFNAKPTGATTSTPLSIAVTNVMVGTSGYTFTYLTLNTTGPFYVTLVTNDNTTQVMAFKKAGPINLAANEHLSLSGNLFTTLASGSQSTTVSVDTTWNTTVLTGSF